MVKVVDSVLNYNMKAKDKLIEMKRKLVEQQIECSPKKRAKPSSAQGRAPSAA